MSYSKNYDNIKWKKCTFKPVKVTKRNKSNQVIGDIKEFISPLDQKTVISSRSQLREFERRNNVRQVGNDYTSSTKPKFWNSMINKYNKG